MRWKFEISLAGWLTIINLFLCLCMGDSIWMHISAGFQVLLSSLCLITAVVTARSQLEESEVLGTSQAACHRI